jgi:hypothetical protein
MVGMKKRYFKVKIRFLDQILGTIPKDRELYESFVMTKVPKPEGISGELEDVEEVEERGWTGFLKDEKGGKGYYLSNHMVLGFLKEAGNTLKEHVGVKALKSKIENFVFVGPRKILFNKSEVDTKVERPIRVRTPKGYRVSLARSDAFNEDMEIEFHLIILEHKEVTPELIEALFEYGEFSGLGQYRKGSYGRFELVSFEESKERLRI